MMGLGRDELDAYDSKAEPVADAAAALTMLEAQGWRTIRKYFPALGTDALDADKKVHPEEEIDGRTFSNHLAEDATNNPMPLLCAIWSIPDTAVTGRLKGLHDELLTAMPLEDYSNWSLARLRAAVEGMSDPAKTVQGTKYRRPKAKLTFRESLQFYGMTVALIRLETKWADKADSPPPDMADFSARLSQQLPKPIPDGQTVGFFLYRPGVLNQPMAKGEFEERADVVKVSRNGTTFHAEQFAVYLTVDDKNWNPSWIEPRDETVDSTLIARKYEHDWTRLDGPYLWFRDDQLNAAVLYRATLRLSGESITIEAEREFQSRGAVKRADRPRNYDPLLIAAFDPVSDSPAQPYSRLTAEPPSLEEQIGTLKAMYAFTSSFQAWCTYGLSQSGFASDGRTWITVMPDPPRSGTPSTPPPVGSHSSASKPASR
jgi:hypothetical protein